MCNVLNGMPLFIADVPTVEFKNGLFYVSDQVGDMRFTRCMAPHTFIRMLRGARQLERAFADQLGTQVVKLAG